MQSDSTYQPPTTREELIRRYARGERTFPDIDLCDADLSGVMLDGADFAPFSWFSDTDFSGASLRGTSFRSCNVKCATFRDADLAGANFEEAAIESIDLEGAALDGTSFVGATFYGIALRAGELPPM